MKPIISKILIVLLAVSSLLTIAASPNNQGIIRTPFTGSEAVVGFDPNTGIPKFVDGKTIVMGFVVYFEDTIPGDPRLSGIATATINYVYDGVEIQGTGPIWGTEHIVNDNGGWNVRFTGHQYNDCQVIIHAHGSGEGAYEGMKAEWEIQSSNCGWTSELSGYITEH
jgi:hypothetical protein